MTRHERLDRSFEETVGPGRLANDRLGQVADLLSRSRTRGPCRTLILAAAAIGLLLPWLLVSQQSMAAAGPTTSTPSPSPTVAVIDSLDGMRTELVEPGVRRLVDDGAGHSASDIPTNAKWLYKLTAAPDGTLWLPRLNEILHLGEPGFVDNPIGPGALELDIDADGGLWVRNGSPVLTPDGSVIGTRQDETDARTVQLVRHPQDGVIASLTYPNDRNELRHWARGMEAMGALLASPLPSEGTDWFLFDTTVAPDGTIWAIEVRAWLETQERLPDRLLRTNGGAWEVVPLAEVGVEVMPYAIELAADGRLLVDLAATGSDPDRGPDERLPLVHEGAERWLGELGVDGRWTVTPIDVGEGTSLRAMAAATTHGAWYPLGDVESRCHGVVLLGNERMERYLADKCIYSLTATPDDRVWVTASDHGGYHDIDAPQIYVIEAEPKAPDEMDE